MIDLAEKNPATDAAWRSPGPSNPTSEKDRNDNASGCLAFPLSIKKSTTSQEAICLMDALRLSVQVTDRKWCFLTHCRHCFGMPTWPRTGRRRGGARMRVLLKDLVLFSCLLAFVTGIVIAVANLLS